MKKLYEKSELTFAILWIIVYCVLQSAANPINEAVGIPYAASALLCLMQAAILLVFLGKNGLTRRFGLCKSPLPAKPFLYYLPLTLLATYNLWNGIALNFTPAGTCCYLLCMLAVGFTEEVIFRGLLYKAMAKDNPRAAAIVSSVTFGLGHFLNLFNGSGAALTETLFQVVSAVAIGFLFVTLFSCGGSLLPCILTHTAINMTSAFADKAGLTSGKGMIFQGILLGITVAYTIILTKTLPKKASE